VWRRQGARPGEKGGREGDMKGGRGAEEGRE